VLRRERPQLIAFTRSRDRSRSAGHRPEHDGRDALALPPMSVELGPRPSQRTLRWAQIRELGEAIMGGSNDPVRIVEQARELVGVLQGLEGRTGPANRGTATCEPRAPRVEASKVHESRGGSVHW